MERKSENRCVVVFGGGRSDHKHLDVNNYATAVIKAVLLTLSGIEMVFFMSY